MTNRSFFSTLLSIFSAVFIWSAIGFHDAFTWFLEVLPAILGLGILFATYSKFPFTRIAYVLMLIHAVILMVGGHYTYAEVPLFDWIKEGLDLERNHYDRVGHLAQGFVPAIVGREILLRSSPLRPGKWLFFIVVCICLAFSAFYEFIEWWVALATGTAADAFLGTQGDIWDTQWDMALAMFGAVFSQILLTKTHDRALAGISKENRKAG
ncbi:MAG: membrane protein [Nitrospinaceae bacterium]|nr:MAG: membrane protein [Nitrospinaceae bacterium]